MLLALSIVALLAGLGLQLWLAARQAGHIIAHQSAVPDAFRDQISLAQHQKAASYTLARLGVERWDLIISTLVLSSKQTSLAIKGSGWTCSTTG